jgi:PAS domain-containing protein
VRSAHYARDLQILARKSTADLTLRLPFADGRQHDIFYRTRNFGLADGRAGGLLGVLVDLSSQHEASREARSAEETSRRILESSPVAIVINRTDGPPLFANSRAAELADTDMQEFMRRPAVSWFRDPALAGQLIAGCSRASPCATSRSSSGATRRGPRTLVSMERIVFQGGPAQLTWVYDITSRKSAEQELRKLSLAVEQSPSMLVITRPDGIIQYANPCFCRIMGRRPDELIGTRPALLDAAGQPIDYLAGQWHALEGRRVEARMPAPACPEPPVGGHLGERAGGGRRPRQGRHQPLRVGPRRRRRPSPGPRHPAPRQAPRRRGRRGQDALPGQHEPRDPHPDERHPGPRQAQPGRRARAPPARLPRKDPGRRRQPAGHRQRHPRLLQDRGRPAGHRGHPLLLDQVLDRLITVVAHRAQEKASASSSRCSPGCRGSSSATRCASGRC